MCLVNGKEGKELLRGDSAKQGRPFGILLQRGWRNEKDDCRFVCLLGGEGSNSVVESLGVALAMFIDVVSFDPLVFNRCLVDLVAP